jgi:hypothetical protein
LRVVVIAGAGRARSAHSSASSSLSPVATPPSYWHCCCWACVALDSFGIGPAAARPTLW